MPWYAAHIVQQVRFERGKKRRQIVFENIVLIKARDGDDAWSQAESLGTYSDGPFAWDGEPAAWEFVGVRKVVETLCAGTTLRHGDELTYNELRFDSLEAVRRFAAGKNSRSTSRDEFRERAVRRQNQKRTSKEARLGAIR
jgi:hypothetical protein